MKTWIARDPYARVGEVIGNGHCVIHIQTVVGLPHTSAWRRGPRVRFVEVERGTVIATFNSIGRYANATDGSSHAAILVEKRTEGLLVVDQWIGKPVGERLIRYKGGVGKPVDDGDAYCVVETEEGPVV